MKQIFFEEVSIQNFLSVGNDPVKVQFNRGFNIITGSNKDKEDRRNGVGKSTIADSINFAVFGSTLRELKKELIQNNLTNETCSVTLTFKVVTPQDTNSYTISRTISPSKCYIYKNEQDITRDSIINTNEYIKELINCSEDVFQNCVIMTVNNTVPFMAKKKVEKRKFIEGIFNLEIFSNMISNLRNDYNETKKDFDIESTRYDENSSTLDNFKQQRQNLLGERNQKVTKYKNRQEDNKRALLDIKSKIKTIERDAIEQNEELIVKIENKIKGLDAQRADKQTRIGRIAGLKSQVEDMLSKIGTDKDTCPTCLREIDEKHIDHINNEKKAIEDKISGYEKEIIEVKEQITEISELENKLTSGIHKIRNKIKTINNDMSDQKVLKQKAKQLLEWQQQLKLDIKELKTGDSNLDDIIDEYIGKVKEIKTKLDSVKRKINMLDVVKYVVSEEGVKSYIVKKILTVFNQKLAYYLKKMDSNCVCIFNEYFEEQIINEKNKICSYFNFSGAERKNIDLACLFAFMDIRRLQGDVAFNFSMYDELFDSSLDEKGVDLVTTILRERVEKYNECVYVISHRKESVKAATGEVIYLEKTNGITRKVEYREIDKDLE
jgi:DNA repair exonuclease SbcCD ATPase subunit